MTRDPIAELVHLYADAVVHHNGEQWGATWAPDAVWELGKGRRVEGRDAILELWHNAMGGFNAVVQTVLNGTYELDEAVLADGSELDTHFAAMGGWIAATLVRLGDVGLSHLPALD